MPKSSSAYISGKKRSRSFRSQLKQGAARAAAKANPKRSRNDGCAGSVAPDAVLQQQQQQHHPAEEVEGSVVALEKRPELSKQSLLLQDDDAAVVVVVTTAPKTAPPPTTITNWACPMCTYENSKSRRRCAVCECRRPPDDKRSSSSSPPSSSSNISSTSTSSTSTSLPVLTAQDQSQSSSSVARVNASASARVPIQAHEASSEVPGTRDPRTRSGTNRLAALAAAAVAPVMDDSVSGCAAAAHAELAVDDAGCNHESKPNKKNVSNSISNNVSTATCSIQQHPPPPPPPLPAPLPAPQESDLERLTRENQALRAKLVVSVDRVSEIHCLLEEQQMTLWHQEQSLLAFAKRNKEMTRRHYEMKQQFGTLMERLQQQDVNAKTTSTTTTDTSIATATTAITAMDQDNATKYSSTMSQTEKKRTVTCRAPLLAADADSTPKMTPRTLQEALSENKESPQDSLDASQSSPFAPQPLQFVPATDVCPRTKQVRGTPASPGRSPTVPIIDRAPTSIVKYHEETATVAPPPPSPAGSSQTIDPDHASQLASLTPALVARMRIAKAVSTQTKPFQQPPNSAASRQDDAARPPPSPAGSSQTIDPDHASQLASLTPAQRGMYTRELKCAASTAAASIRVENQARRVTLEKRDPSTTAAASNSRATPAADPRLISKPAAWQTGRATTTATKKPPLLNSTNRRSGTTKTALPMRTTSTWISNAPAREFIQNMDDATRRQGRGNTAAMPAPSKATISSDGGGPQWTTSRRQSRSSTAATATASGATTRTSKTGGTSLWDDESSQEPNYAYKETVRCKQVRQGLPCHDCSECRAFYEALRVSGHFDNTTSSQAALMMPSSSSAAAGANGVLQHSRHRARFTPPETPVDFWELDFIDEKRERERLAEEQERQAELEQEEAEQERQAELERPAVEEQERRSAADSKYRV